MGRGAVIALIGLILLAGCEAEPTPFPVEIVATPSPVAVSPERPPIRYALDANTRDAIAERDLLSASAQVIQLDEAANPANLGTTWEVAAAYGVAEGWNRSPATPTVALVVAPSAFPEGVPALILSVINPDALVLDLPFAGAAALVDGETRPVAVIRETLANDGQPDGFGVALGSVYVPGAAVAQAQLQAANIRTRLVLLDDDAMRSALQAGRVQMALVTWETAAEASAWRAVFGAEYVRALYTTPIRYLASDKVTLQFTPGGWPLPTWSDP
jgi:hypothetical protein